MRKVKLREVLFVGPFLLWAGWDSFQELGELEEHGGSMYVGRTTKFLYDVGGKWAVLIGIWGLVAAYAWAVWATYKRERAERTASPAPARPAPAAAARTSTAAPARMSTPAPARTSTATPRPAVVAPRPSVMTPVKAEPQFLR